MSVRFSILMPVYNRKEFVRQAIDSVLSQSFTSFELIAIDDGSTDGADEVVKSYGSRVRFMQQPNQGPEVARNKAAAVAQGEYLVILDSDDFMFPFALETFDRVIRHFNSPPVITGKTRYFRDGQTIPAEEYLPKPIEVVEYRDYLSKSKTLATNSIIMKKSVYDAVGGYRNSTPKTWTNDDMYLLLMAGLYSPCIVIQKPATSAYRIHGGNTIGNVKSISDGLLALARLEREGKFPGGMARQSDRYAILGGRSLWWAMKYNWPNGQKKEAIKLFLGTAPMIAVATWKRILRTFQKPATEIVLPEERSQETSSVEMSIPGGR
jgi:glycosyltransferase involved in cell wall biosynthesis